MFSKSICFVSIIIVNISFGCGFINIHPELRSYPVKGNVDKPLILTPYIEDGKIELARNLSYVEPLIGNIVSYSGFFTVDKQYNSNLFFWFFPAKNNSETAPIVLWLEGGPGGTSLFSLFSEHGPFNITKEQTLGLRNYTWILTHNMIYMDNPVGAGFSFTDDDKGYSRNEEHVSSNLYKAMIQFFQMFPEYQQNEFFITGESYAGKYAPALAYTIHTNNPEAKLKINLKGIAIGNAWSAPEYLMIYSDYLYQIGLIDANGRAMMKKKENEIISYIQQQEWSKAADAYYQLLLSVTPPSLFTNLTGFKCFYNFKFFQKDYIKFKTIDGFVGTEKMRKALHVGDAIFYNDSKVFETMKEDFMQSVKPLVEVMLENYRVLMYSGQQDIIVAYPLTVAFHQALNWSGSEAYKTAERQKWYINGTLAGYIKTVKNFTEVLVRNAGHLVPTDQPLWAFELITRFTHNEL